MFSKFFILKFETILGGSMSEILGGYCPNEAGGELIWFKYIFIKIIKLMYFSVKSS